MLGEQFFGVEQQVVEIDGADSFEVVLIAAIGGGGQLLAFGVGEFNRLRRPHGCRLPAAHDREQIAGRRARRWGPAARGGPCGPGSPARCDRR